MSDSAGPILQLHLEPREPMEVAELTAALGSLARQYQTFAVANGLSEKASDARLLVSSVQPGSIDISLLPDWLDAATLGGLLMPLIDKYEMIQKFAEQIKGLLELFGGEKKSTAEVSISDCDDAVNIVKPVAEHGGLQTFNVFNGPVSVNVLTTTTNQARQIIEGATAQKIALQAVKPEAEKRQRVSMTWSRLDREKVKSDRKTTPDRATIEEIDSKPHAVFFTDEVSFLKSEMIADEENPYRQVYFVDVEVSRAAGGKVTAYRVVGYHGKEDL
jgi:hypothetical protein